MCRGRHAGRPRQSSWNESSQVCTATNVIGRRPGWQGLSITTPTSAAREHYRDSRSGRSSSFDYVIGLAGWGQRCGEVSTSWRRSDAPDRGHQPLRLQRPPRRNPRQRWLSAEKVVSCVVTPGPNKKPGRSRVSRGHGQALRPPSAPARHVHSAGPLRSAAVP